MATVKSGILGFHNMAIIDPTTQELVGGGLLKITDSVNIDFGETVAALKGGDGNHPYSTAVVDCNSSVTIPVKEFPVGMMSLLNRSTAVETTAETTGGFSTPTNVTGTSVVAATTGITAVVSATASGTLKEGIYILKAASATTLNVYAYTDFSCLALESDLTGLVNGTPYTITTGTATAITEIGMTVTGGSGTIGFTEDDTAVVTIRKINTGYSDVPVQDCVTSQYYTVFLFFQPTPEGALEYLKLYRCTVSRGAHSAPIRDYHSTEITLSPTKDHSNDYEVGSWHRTLG